MCSRAYELITFVGVVSIQSRQLHQQGTRRTSLLTCIAGSKGDSPNRETTLPYHAGAPETIIMKCKHVYYLIPLDQQTPQSANECIPKSNKTPIAHCKCQKTPTNPSPHLPSVFHRIALNSYIWIFAKTFLLNAVTNVCIHYVSHTHFPSSLVQRSSLQLIPASH